MMATVGTMLRRKTENGTVTKGARGRGRWASEGGIEGRGSRGGTCFGKKKTRRGGVDFAVHPIVSAEKLNITVMEVPTPSAGERGLFTVRSAFKLGGGWGDCLLFTAGKKLVRRRSPPPRSVDLSNGQGVNGRGTRKLTGPPKGRLAEGKGRPGGAVSGGLLEFRGRSGNSKI